jgi:hypothetical protein
MFKGFKACHSEYQRRFFAALFASISLAASISAQPKGEIAIRAYFDKRAISPGTACPVILEISNPTDCDLCLSERVAVSCEVTSKEVGSTPHEGAAVIDFGIPTPECHEPKYSLHFRNVARTDGPVEYGRSKVVAHKRVANIAIPAKSAALIKVLVLPNALALGENSISVQLKCENDIIVGNTDEATITVGH